MQYCKFTYQNITDLNFFYNGELIKPKDFSKKIKESISLKNKSIISIAVSSKFIKENFKKKNKNEILLKKILQRQKKPELQKEKASLEKYSKTLEDMAIYGTIVKNQIIKKEKNNPEKFISIKEATNEENRKNNTSPNFVMGLLAQIFVNKKFKTFIQKNSINDNDTSFTTLQFLSNGLGSNKKYDLHFEINKEKVEKLLCDEDSQRKFNDNLKSIIEKEYGVSQDKDIVTFPRHGCYQLTVLFKNVFDLDENEMRNRLKKYPELKFLNQLRKELLINGCKLSPDLFDHSDDNRDGGWGVGETRGGEKYNPPIDWTCYGFNVKNK